MTSLYAGSRSLSLSEASGHAPVADRLAVAQAHHEQPVPRIAPALEN
jgi:hypothetical protein